MWLKLFWGVFVFSTHRMLHVFSNYSVLSRTISFQTNGLHETSSQQGPFIDFIAFFSPFPADAIPAPHISSHRHCSRVCSWIVRTLRKRKNVSLPRKDSFSLVFLLNCTEDASVTFAEVSAVSLIQRQGLLMEVEVSKNKRSLLVSV